MKPSFVIALSVILVNSACASYESTSPPAPVLSQMQISQDEQDIRVEADPYSDPVEQETYFDANFNAAGIVAVQVRISNNSTKSYLVRSHDMALEVTEDIVFNPVSSNSVVHTVGEEGSVVGAAIAFGLIGLIAASNAEEEARTARTTDYRNKVFKDTTLDEGESRHGFVFFIPSKGTDPCDKATLKIRLIDHDGPDHVTTRLALTDVRYTGVEEAGESSAEGASAGGVAEKQESPEEQAAAFAVPDEAPIHSKQTAEAYLKKNVDDVKRDLFEYNKEHHLTSYTGSFRNYVMHGTKVLEVAGDQAIVVLNFDYGSNWNPRFASKVLRMQWIGSDLKIVGHS